MDAFFLIISLLSSAELVEMVRVGTEFLRLPEDDPQHVHGPDFVNGSNLIWAELIARSEYDAARAVFDLANTTVEAIVGEGVLPDGLSYDDYLTTFIADSNAANAAGERDYLN